jgi:hypothetical protein
MLRGSHSGKITYIEFKILQAQKRAALHLKLSPASFNQYNLVDIRRFV